jgi:hypothetical protein
MTTQKKITATCAILDINTDKVISERVIGEFDTVDSASFAANKERKEGESVCLYNAPMQEPEDMSALEMAELEMEWDLATRVFNYYYKTTQT